MKRKIVQKKKFLIFYRKFIEILFFGNIKKKKYFEFTFCVDEGISRELRRLLTWNSNKRKKLLKI